MNGKKIGKREKNVSLNLINTVEKSPPSFNQIERERKVLTLDTACTQPAHWLVGIDLLDNFCS